MKRNKMTTIMNNQRNLFYLSLLCFAISLILFVSTIYIQVITTTTTTANNNVKHQTHNELLIGYKILHHTLKKESQLKYLHLLRQVLIYRGRPLGAIDGIMAVIYDTSRVRAKELEILFDEPYVPRITLRDAPQSAIGDSIQNDVEKSSLHELVLSPFLFPFVSKTTSSSRSSDLKSENWIVRFIFIQAQATRMVVALSASLIKFETNQVRKNWLTKLSAEYETIRETLIEYNSMQLSSCS